MSEAVPISSEWVNSCNLRVDEVWVPSQFHVDEFIKAGVDKNKIFRIPEATDVYLWDPDIVEPLSIEKLDKNNFNFLSVFKWENRKGWDILLQAYFEEFDANEPVTLFLQTYLYGDWNARNPESVKSKIAQYARKLGHSSLSALPKVEVLTKELPARDMPRLYKAFDAFVLPSRGEGWGLPIMEAMAMRLDKFFFFLKMYIHYNKKISIKYAYNCNKLEWTN